MFTEVQTFQGNWRKNLAQLVEVFGISTKELITCLKATDSVISGSSILWAVTEYCELKDYDGDIDIFIPYRKSEFRHTKLIFELFLKSNGYYIDTSKYKFDKPEECPVCYIAEEDSPYALITQYPCQHWICEDCSARIKQYNRNKTICPLCRTENKQQMTFMDESKEEGEYDEVIHMRYFQEFKNQITQRRVQCIYVSNIMHSISKFDLSICQLYFTGISLFVRKAENITSLIGECNHPFALTEKQKKRIEKYRNRGFSITSKYACHVMNTVLDTLPFEKDVIQHVVYPFLKQREEKQYRF